MKSSGADMSQCGRYRYRLWRIWGTGESVLWIMLNPSTADADRDDATIRRCKAFTSAWGCGGLNVVNLFALRATDPRELKTARDPVGPRNDRMLQHMAACRHKYIVAAWGAHGGLFNREREVVRLLSSMKALDCLGVTKAGHPRHPLYLPGTAKPIPFPTGT